MAILARIEHLLSKLKGQKPFDLSKYLSTSCIAYLDTTDRGEAIDALVATLHKAGKAHQPLLFNAAVRAREKKSSTALGDGIAIPHVKSKAYTEFFLAVGIVKNNYLHWDSAHQDPIHFVFLIGGPDDRPEEYLQLLSHLTTAVKGQEERDKLLLCTSPEEVFSILR